MPPFCLLPGSITPVTNHLIFQSSCFVFVWFSLCADRSILIFTIQSFLKINDHIVSFRLELCHCSLIFLPEFKALEEKSGVFGRSSLLPTSPSSINVDKCDDLLTTRCPYLEGYSTVIVSRSALNILRLGQRTKHKSL